MVFVVGIFPFIIFAPTPKRNPPNAKKKKQKKRLFFCVKRKKIAIFCVNYNTLAKQFTYNKKKWNFQR